MISRESIVQSLRDAGVHPGDHLVVHASLRSIGVIDGGADAVIEALVEVVGERGTVAMLSPSTDFFAPQFPAESPGQAVRLGRCTSECRRGIFVHR